MEYNTLLRQLESFFAEASNSISQLQHANNSEHHFTNISLDSDSTESKLQKIVNVLHEITTIVSKGKRICDDEVHSNGDVSELQMRIEQISDLLKESNRLLEESRVEKEALSQQNAKLERNLQMLTESHCEMENNINEMQKAKEDMLDLYERKINHFLQNLELKDMQIKSLENYIREIKGRNESCNASVNGGYVGRIVNKGEYREMIRKRGDGGYFEKNENHERELNKYLSRFANDYTFGNYYRNDIDDNINTNTNNDINNNMNNESNHSSFNEDEMNLSDNNNNSIEWNNKNINKATIGKIYKNKK